MPRLWAAADATVPNRIARPWHVRTGETEPWLLAALGCTLRWKALFAPHAGAGWCSRETTSMSARSRPSSSATDFRKYVNAEIIGVEAPA